MRRTDIMRQHSSLAGNNTRKQYPIGETSKMVDAETGLHIKPPMKTADGGFALLEVSPTPTNLQFVSFSTIGTSKTPGIIMFEYPNMMLTSASTVYVRYSRKYKCYENTAGYTSYFDSYIFPAESYQSRSSGYALTTIASGWSEGNVGYPSGTARVVTGFVYENFVSCSFAYAGSYQISGSGTRYRYTVHASGFGINNNVWTGSAELLRGGDTSGAAWSCRLHHMGLVTGVVDPGMTDPLYAVLSPLTNPNKLSNWNQQVFTVQVCAKVGFNWAPSPWTPGISHTYDTWKSHSGLA